MLLVLFWLASDQAEHQAPWASCDIIHGHLMMFNCLQITCNSIIMIIAYQRAKWTEIWESMTLVAHLHRYLWHCSIQDNVGSFGARFSKWSLIQKRLPVVIECLQSEREGNLVLGNTSRHTHGSIKYGLIRVLFFNRELWITYHYLRPLSESYISIFNSHGESQITLWQKWSSRRSMFNSHHVFQIGI